MKKCAYADKKGFGFVRYDTHEEAAFAIQLANGRDPMWEINESRQLGLRLWACFASIDSLPHDIYFNI